jgi:hypothetical protein
MRITRKSNRVKYCQWYLQNIKPEARASEIIDHAVANKELGNNLYVDAKVLGILMNQKKDLFESYEVEGSKARIWRLKPQPIVKQFRQTPLEECISKQSE